MLALRKFLMHFALAAMPLMGGGAQAAEPPKGSLVIIGGALRSDNAPVWQRIVQLAGGQGARIAVFPSAAANPARSGQFIVSRLNQHGADAFLVPLAVKLEGSDFRKVAEDTALAASVRAAGGVYFSGGDQARITQAMIRADGSRSALLDAVWDVYRRGGVVAGTSAGAAIMSSTMFYEVKTVFSTLRGGINEGREIAPGLGFIGDDIFIDQHLLTRGRFARMIPAMLKKGYKIGLGIDENTAMVIDSKRQVEIVGYKGALLIDLTRAMTDPKAIGFNVSGVNLSYLDRGDKYDIDQRRFIPSPEKVEGLLDPARPSLNLPVFTADILGPNAVIDLMEKLIDNAQREAIGIAIGHPAEQLPEMGFEFRFSKTADSIGYASSVAEAYSILNMRLDIRPIEIPHPLYRYK